MTPGRAAAALLAACLGASAAGCGGDAARHGGVGRHLSVYNWSDYIGKTTIADFERETAIKVDYDTFDADATLEAKLLSGGSGYDVVNTATNYFSRQIKAGAYQKLDRRLLSNWGNLDLIFKPECMRRLSDCGVTFLDSAEDVL